jgi:hypothetical protein
MEVKTKLRPGENGTTTRLKQYGEQLVCVRYRYDKPRRKRYETVELIIDGKDWILDTLVPAGKRVFIKIGYGEMELREQVKLQAVTGTRTRRHGNWNTGKLSNQGWNGALLTRIYLCSWQMCQQDFYTCQV